jgi:hypothetical protein
MEDRAFVDGASARRTTFYLQMQAELAGIARDKVECLHALTKADRHGLFDLAWLDHCPLLEIARSSEGFKAIRNNVLMRAESVYDALWSP